MWFETIELTLTAIFWGTKMNKKLQEKIAMTLSESSVLIQYDLFKEVKEKLPEEWKENPDFSQQAKIFEHALITRGIRFSPLN